DGGSPDPSAGTEGGNLVGSAGEVDQQVDTGGGRKKWPLLIAGGGVVAAVGGFFAYKSARDKQELLCNLTEDGTCDTRIKAENATTADGYRSDMRTRERLYWGLWGVGAAAIGAGLVLYFM